MRRILVLIAAVAATACTDQSMTRQPRYGPNAPAPAFAGGSAARQPPAGTVSQGDAAYEGASTNPPPVDMALLERGRERFGIFCAPCHGFEGDGDGAIVRRGFPHPPSYYEPALMSAPAQLFFDTITNGFGVMYSYASRVPPHDRWAIAAYIRALQQSRSAPPAEAPEAASADDAGATRAGMSP
jgi:mono/diheme cytochrome c family protein